MTASLDGMILWSAFIGFVIYLIVHFFIFRQVSDRKVIQWLIRTFLLGGIINISLGLLLSSQFHRLVNHGAWVVIVTGGCSFFIYGLLCFIYVLCVFGPYESSIRLRLLRELEIAGAQGLTQEEILARYNTEIILNRRLNRFIGSGEVVLLGDSFKLGKVKKNVFSFLEDMAQFLKKVTRTP